MHPRKDPPAQAHPAPSKSEPKQEARAKVPPFGAWEGGGEVGYTQSFENVRKNNKNGRTVTSEPSSDSPQLNCDVSEAKEGRSKVPQFGGWNEGENGAYTAYFENAENKNAGPVPDPAESQLNRDVNNKARPSTAVGTKNKADDHQLRNANRGSDCSVATSETPSRNGKQNPGGQSPIHQKGGRLEQKPPAGRGSQTPERDSNSSMGCLEH